MTTALPEVQHADIARIFALQQQHRYQVAASTARERRAKLIRLRDTLDKYNDRIFEAMWADFRKPKAEVIISETYPVASEIKTALRDLSEWMQARPVPTPVALLGTRSEWQPVAKGVVLLISPWNYPINLTFYPLVSAIAAGNCVIVKPSELTPNTSAVIADIIREAFEPHEVAVFEGDANIAKALLALPFNHIFFTGSPLIGKAVMQAAAQHLASVTLELGGKSPAIIDPSAKLDDAIEKLCAIKFINCGQTCIAPDYILVHESIAEQFLKRCVARIHKSFGDTADKQQASDSYTRIVNDRHWTRLHYLLDDALQRGATVAYGGKHDASQRYIGPTILTDVPTDALIWQEEIFGPLMLVRTYRDLDEAIAFQNAQPTPLAQYIFSRDRSTQKRLLRETIAGDTTINDAGVGFLNDNLPFGGHNNSGIGKAHGEAGFLEMSHRRGIMRQQTWFNTFQLFYPPYSNLTIRLLNIVKRWL